MLEVYNWIRIAIPLHSSMSTVSDFVFNGISRLGDDACSMDQNSIQNAAACSYTLTDFSAQDCTMSRARQFATSQPGVNYKGGYGGATNGCMVDINSRLTIGSLQTHPRAKLDLFPRPYATVPFLGRGAVDPVVESQLKFGETGSNRRTQTLYAEKNYSPYHITPLIPEMQQRAEIHNMALANDQMRGGFATREQGRDADSYSNGNTSFFRSR